MFSVYATVRVHCVPGIPRLNRLWVDFLVFLRFVLQCVCYFRRMVTVFCLHWATWGLMLGPNQFEVGLGPIWFEPFSSHQKEWKKTQKNAKKKRFLPVKYKKHQKHEKSANKPKLSSVVSQHGLHGLHGVKTGLTWTWQSPKWTKTTRYSLNLRST
jgi:hypothetical protein